MKETALAYSPVKPYDCPIPLIPDAIMLRKIGALSGLILLIAGCSSSNAPPTASATVSLWYRAGYHDAMAGKIVRDNDTLAEWYGDPQVDRDQYLKGYTAGQAEFCQPATVRNWGEQRRNFPASCDGVPGAEQLRQQWQNGIGHTDPVTP